MDCMTISTFRNLERQAIRQHYYETFAQERARKNTIPYSKLSAETNKTADTNQTAKLNCLA